MKRTTSTGLILALVTTSAFAGPARLSAEDLEDKVERMERELQEMKQELRQQKEAQQKAQEAQEKAQQEARDKILAEPPTPAQVIAQATPVPVYREVLDRLKFGGYGSFRFETSSLPDVNNTFTLRRLVLTGDAAIASRLRAYYEVEYERFQKLELEKSLTVTDGGIQSKSTIEGTDDSEISLEQAWTQFDAYDWLRLRAGAVLVPLGRFNINHDDDLWNLPRRSLVDRGVPVLPVKAAWDELGAGFNGDIPISDTVAGKYQLYVMNGVTLNSNIETLAQARVGDTTLIESEVELEPTAGSFNLDSKNAKALAGRFALSPFLNSEIAASFYWGRYTPDFLPSENVYSLSGDGLYTLGPFEIEGEYVFTHFGGVDNLARGFAQVAINQESSIENDVVENEVDFELSQLATSKQGYWLELRYRFWPQFLNSTLFGSPFKHPQMIGVFRGEQVWLGGLVQQVNFQNGVLTSLEKQDRFVNRFTVGIAYRPVPLVVFQLAYEYTLTNSGDSLAGVTNYLPAGVNEDHQNSIMIGTAFGF